MPQSAVRLFLRTSALLAVLGFVCSAYAQTSISGVVNEYTKILNVDVCHNSVLVPSKGSLAAGDRVLIIQMKGASIDRSDTKQFGTLGSVAGAGSYEFATVDSVPASGIPWIRLRNKIVNTYDVTSAVQLIRVPTYTDVVISGALTATAWSDQTGTGGVVAIEASGKITVNAPVDVSAKGFSGGLVSNASPNSSLTGYVYDFTSGDGGQKGEGIAKLVSGEDAGRGPLANGGGGGNAKNAGGGGGSNGGNGGRGGDQSTSVSQLAIGGIGGVVIPTAPSALYAGGGGGGGHQNDGLGTNGANGGGIILLRANTIAGSQSVLANGGDAGNAVGDGAGGGGGGGSILLDVQQITGSVSFQARGGNGGNVSSGVNPYCYAPGGGGGGGVILTTGIAAPVGANISGGKAGLLTGSTSTCNNTNYGATDGSAGVIVSSAKIIEGTIPMVYPHVLKSSYSVCEGQSVQVGATNGTAYLWSPATGLDDPSSPNPKASPLQTTTYVVDISSGACVFRDSLMVTVLPKPDAKITGGTTLCLGSTETYHVLSQKGAGYTWNVVGGGITSATNLDSVTISWTTSGTGSLTVIVDNGNCSSTQTITVVTGNKIVPLVVGSSATCYGDSITLGTKDAYSSYLWSTNETTPTIRVSKSGTYSVTVSAAGGCNGTSLDFPVTVYPKSIIGISADRVTLDSATDSIALHATPGFSSYAWSDGLTGATRNALYPGWYEITGVDPNGCVATDSILIDSAQSIISMDLALPSLAAAPGESVSFPVQLIASKFLDINPLTDFDYELRFNKTLLVPNDGSLPSRDSGDDRILSIKLSRDPKTLSGVLQTIGFTATLGDQLQTPVTLESFRSSAGKRIKVKVTSGLFTLNKVCPAGGNRLFSVKGALTLAAISPNPASNSIAVQYGTPENGRLQLILFDMLGRRIKAFIDQEALQGVYDQQIDVSSIVPGRYLLLLRTPSESLHQTLEIVR